MAKVYSDDLRRKLLGAYDRELGRIVEGLVVEAFKNEGFDPERTGRGSDFSATIARGIDSDWEKQDVGRLVFNSSYRGRSLTFLVEVKATREDSVRMSWLQGDTAAKNQNSYVLCVVDLHDEEDLSRQILLQDERTCDLISNCIRLVPSIGETLAVAVQNLSSAATTSEPGIEVEKADEIRFRILRSIWQQGRHLSEWARSVRGALDQELGPH